MKNEVALTFPEALQHIVTTSICALRPEDTRLRKRAARRHQLSRIGSGPTCYQQRAIRCVIALDWEAAITVLGHVVDRPRRP